MLMKNCNAFDFTHRQIFKTLERYSLGGESPFKEGGPVHLHTLHIPKASTGSYLFEHNGAGDLARNCGKNKSEPSGD